MTESVRPRFSVQQWVDNPQAVLEQWGAAIQDSADAIATSGMWWAAVGALALPILKMVPYVGSYVHLLDEFITPKGRLDDKKVVAILVKTIESMDSDMSVKDLKHKLAGMRDPSLNAKVEALVGKSV